MITFKAKDFDYSGTKDRVEGECLSTDTKPVGGVANGSTLIEMDTGDKFMYDEANQTWLNITNPGGGGSAEVWFAGASYVDDGGTRTFTLSNYGFVDHFDELFENAENYSVYLDGTELPLFNDSGTIKSWYDNSSLPSLLVGLDASEGSIAGYATFLDASTAPTSVEVSVKAK